MAIGYFKFVVLWHQKGVPKLESKKPSNCSTLRLTELPWPKLNWKTWLSQRNLSRYEHISQQLDSPICPESRIEEEETPFRHFGQCPELKNFIFNWFYFCRISGINQGGITLKPSFELMASSQKLAGSRDSSDFLQVQVQGNRGNWKRWRLKTILTSVEFLEWLDERCWSYSLRTSLLKLLAFSFLLIGDWFDSDVKKKRKWQIVDNYNTVFHSFFQLQIPGHDLKWKHSSISDADVPW